MATTTPSRTTAQVLRKLGLNRTATTASGHTAYAIDGEPAHWLVRMTPTRWIIVELQERGIHPIKAIDLEDWSRTSRWVAHATAERVRKGERGQAAPGWYTEVDQNHGTDPYRTIEAMLTGMLAEFAARRAALRETWSRNTAGARTSAAVAWTFILDGDATPEEQERKERAGRMADSYMAKHGTHGWTTGGRPEEHHYSWLTWYTIATMHFRDLAKAA